MAMRTLPSTEFLRECFTYNPDTGNLTWNTRPRDHFATLRACNLWNTRFSGKVAKSISASGYIYVGIYTKLYAAHRLIFKMVTGVDPAEEVDHVNGIRTDNRWLNLRNASHKENSRNKRRQPSNAGLRGVHFRRGKFGASICIDYVKKYLGDFDTAEEAHAAYCKAAKQAHGEFAHYGSPPPPPPP